MPKPRLDDANIEFEFTTEESISARALDPVKIAWLQTKYSKLWKERNSTPAPELPELDRSYFLKIAEIDGKLGLIQELLDDHKNAMVDLSTRNQEIQTAVETEASLSERAARQVHRIPTN